MVKLLVIGLLALIVIVGLAGGFETRKVNSAQGPSSASWAKVCEVSGLCPIGK